MMTLLLISFTSLEMSDLDLQHLQAEQQYTILMSGLELIMRRLFNEIYTSSKNKMKDDKRLAKKQRKIPQKKLVFF